LTTLTIQLAALSPWQHRLLQWLGHDVAASPSSGQADLLWTNVPASWGVFVLIAVLAAALYAVFALYRHELESCPPWAKVVLATVRSGVVLLLACIFLGPAVVYWQHRTIQPTVVLARDASQSMNTADSYSDPAAARLVAAALAKNESQITATRPTRVEIVNELLARDHRRLLDALARKGRLQVLDFADQATKLEMSLNLPPLVAEGRGTDLSSAVRQSLAVDRPAAVVLFTDGQHTAKDDPLGAAREAKSRGVPLLVVGVGDPTRRKNLSVAKVYARPQAWQEEPFEVDAVIRFENAEAADVRLDLVEQRVGDNDQPASGGTVVQTMQMAAPEKGNGQRSAQFFHTVHEPGRFVYSVRASAISGDNDEADNQLVSNVVKVLSREQIRVLLVAGAPTWDYRLVQKLLARDKTIHLSCWLQTLDEHRPQEGTRPNSRLPTT
jgi:hypothetical protein